LQIDYQLKIVIILTFGFSLASLFGYIAQRLKLSPILGFLLGGYVIGPFSPGYVADLELSEQLAEIGVVLMLFGVGLHFKWQDLMNVKEIAVPGAVLQTFVATMCGTVAVYSLGWSLESGIIIGISIGVASTVVMIRVLNDNHLLETREGHIAIGWLVVEDVMTVAFLILIPIFKDAFEVGNVSVLTVLTSIGLILLKFTLLALFMFTIGRRFVVFVLIHVARLRSNELFTLTILALIFLIATSSALVFGTSIALGAFIAGMIIGQTVMRHQASANALPMKDAFAVIFFLTIGMLFNPHAIIEYWPLFLSILIIILLVKPLIAFALMKIYGYPLFMALTVAIALAQIGEFSFILAEQTAKLNLLPNDGYDIIIACALISISLNPLMFKLLDYCKTKRLLDPTAAPLNTFQSKTKITGQAIVIGYGPIGKVVTSILEKEGYQTIVIDANVDTISTLTEEKKRAVYGDASHPNILDSAHLDKASLLVITTPNLATSLAIIPLARQFNPTIQILVRAQYISEQEILKALNVKVVCNEQETVTAFSQAIFQLIT
jgi:monovalent cation:H+ antiporter-2, CPA2 family